MDGSSFDSLTRRFADGTGNRRTLIRGLAVAGIAAIGLGQSVEAKSCRANSQTCRVDSECCSGYCVIDAKTGRRLCSPCSPQTHICGDTCVANDDVTQCGASCTACEERACHTASCSGGKCTYTPFTEPGTCGNSNTGNCCGGTCCFSHGHCNTNTFQCEYSCFTGETRIAMADGYSKPISEVTVGDFVIGDGGQINRVIGIETPALGGRSLYGLNGSAPFVTAEHPFMTNDGWKSFNPAATAAEQPNLAVGTLQTGDELQLLVPSRIAVFAGAAGADTVEIQTLGYRVNAIDASTAAPWTTVYNLLLDGNNTYFANDLLVHNKG